MAIVTRPGLKTPQHQEIRVRNEETSAWLAGGHVTWTHEVLQVIAHEATRAISCRGVVITTNAAREEAHEDGSGAAKEARHDAHDLAALGWPEVLGVREESRDINPTRDSRVRFTAQRRTAV